jgi:hypothetical protein
MLRVLLVVGVLGTIAGCSPAQEGDAGVLDGGDASDVRVTPDACPMRPGGGAGACTIEGERMCLGGGSGCRCVGGCWHCTPDECWVTDAGIDDGGMVDEDGGADDGGVVDDDAGLDAGVLDVGASDTGVDAPVAVDAGHDAPADAGVPATMTYCVDIDVDNFCNMAVDPTEITIPADQIAYFCWRNRSEDYPVDVWLSYGGGYTDLAPGATWNEPPGHCLGPTPHDEYADITTACSEHRFLIHCL